MRVGGEKERGCGGKGGWRLGEAVGGGGWGRLGGGWRGRHGKTVSCWGEWVGGWTRGRGGGEERERESS